MAQISDWTTQLEGRARAWGRGFANMFRKEAYEWWGTGRWIQQAVLWLVICNGFAGLLLFALPLLLGTGQHTAGMPVIDPVDAGINLFLVSSMTGISIGIALIAQGQVIDEKVLGTAEWVLSKPIARSAFLLAKISATLLAALVLMIALPGMVMYGLLYLQMGQPFPASRFLIAEGILILNTLFYLALAFLLGTITSNRAVVIGGVIASVFGPQLLLQFFPVLINLTPWGLVFWTRLLASSAPISREILLPITITALLSMGCLVLSIVIFDRTEL